MRAPGYVGNSSTSSYIIAYDPIFFGDLESLFKEYFIGRESVIVDPEEFYGRFDPGGERDFFRQAVKDEKDSGKNVIFLELDNEFCVLIDMLKMVNESNGGEKLCVIYGLYPE